MIKKLNILCVGLLIFQPLFVFAAESDVAGSRELSALSNVVTGQLGFFVALVLAIWGIWKMFVSGENAAGFILLICGAALTIFPGIFNFAESIVVPFAKAITGG
ncbi:MAG: hypothetical protein WAZ18_00305 [Alphaproteobacteria bacterium]